MTSVPKRYVPASLNPKDKRIQRKQLKNSRNLYKKKVYHTRKKVKSFVSKPSNHVQNAKRIYKIPSVRISRKLSQKTGCSLKGLRKIQSKGEGAYFSSGSRPNQTSQSWGVARLASSVTGGKASMVDYRILEKYCNKNSRALKLARKTMKKNKHSYGKRKVPKVKL
jgi:hypothetical protein